MRFCGVIFHVSISCLKNREKIVYCLFEICSNIDLFEKADLTERVREVLDENNDLSASNQGMLNLYSFKWIVVH